MGLFGAPTFMKKESKKHIRFVANNIVRALEEVSEGAYTYEKNGETYLNYPTPQNAFTSLCEQLDKLCKNVIKIENDSKTP